MELKKTIEAALFMSPKPLPLQELAGVCKIPELAVVETSAMELMKEFNSRDSALEIVKEVEGYRMRVKPEFDQNVTHLAASSELSKAIMKTLAYIAFKQPVKQSQVIKFRSSKAYEEIKILEEKGFISRERSGLTYNVRTTKKFLEYFGKGSIMLKKNPKYGEEKGTKESSAKKTVTQF